MHLLLKVVVTVAFVLGSAALGFAISRRSPNSQKRELDAALASAEVTVSAAVRARLEQHYARRSRWGAIGGGACFGLGTAVSLGLPRDDYSWLLGVAGMFVGVQFGSALSALVGSRPLTERVRVASLQPHGMTDYLTRRQLVCEGLFVVAGLALAIAGGIALIQSRPNEYVGWLAVALGGVVFLVSAAALVLQQRMLNTPRRGDGELPLVVNDVVLAGGLRDLMAAAGAAVFFAGYIMLLALGTPWWEIGLWLAFAALLMKVVVDPRVLPRMAPVAHQLAGKSRA